MPSSTVATMSSWHWVSTSVTRSDADDLVAATSTFPEVSTMSDPAATAAVFVKAPKAGQDMRLDPPVAGAETLRRAALAGIGVVALKADGVILADEPETLRSLAGELRLVVVGI